MTHKYKIGSIVWFRGDWYEIIQLRTDNGHRTYRLDSGKIVHENLISPR